MVMTKQVSGIRRSRHKSEETGGKLVTTEYLIEAEPPLVPEKVALGHTVRVAQGSVDRWKARPASGKAGEPLDNHTLAVHELIEAYRATGATIAAVDAPEQKPGKPARATKGAPAKDRGGARAPKQPKEQAAKPPKARAPRKTKPAAAADPIPAGTDGGAEHPAVTTSGETAPSAVTAEPVLPPAEMIPAGPEHAAALDDGSLPPSADGAPLEDAVLDDPEAAAAVAGQDAWDEGYPEPASGKHRAPAGLDDPFAVDPDNPFSGSGFVR
jgi:hypothetical protein